MPSESNSINAKPIAAQGAMAARIRSHAWAATPLGPMESWSSALIGTLNLILASPVPIQLLWGPEFVVLYNDAFRQQLGLLDERALGSPASVVWAQAWPLVVEKLHATLRSGAVTDERGARIPVNRRGTLEDTYWNFSYSPVFETDGSIAGVLNISHDVTKEVIAEAQLRSSERRSDHILSSIGDAVIVTNAQSCVTRMNRVAEGLTGWSASDARGKKLSEVFQILHAGTRERMEDPADKVLRLGTIVGLANHTILVRRDGQDVHIEDSAAPIRDDDGDFQGVVLVFRDVTAQRAAEKVLEEAQQQTSRSEALLDLMMNTLPAYVSYIDAEFRYVRVNKGYETLLGKPTEQIVGKTIDEVLGPAAANTVRGPLTKALAGKRQQFTYDITENGSTLVLDVSHIPYVDVDGAVMGVVIEAHDVTQQKRAEETLRRSEERFRSLIERSSVGMAIGDTRGDLRYVNPALLALLGYTEQEVRDGKLRWDQITPEKYADPDRKAIQELASRGVATPYEKTYIAKNGTPVPLLIGASVIPGERDGEGGEDIAVFATDLTMQKKAEAALLQAEKLAAVGKLATSISHEINNPLEAVTNLIYIARQAPELSQLTLDTLDSADRELARVAQVTSQTLRFHRQSTAPIDARPDVLVDEVLRLFQPRLDNSQIEVQRRYDVGLRVPCYEGDIRQIFANIIGNAIDVMREGGVLTVKTSAATRWSTGKPGVKISFCDTGLGMDEQTRQRIFDAFFTTKGINGTGLGLWISCRIVHKHGGYIRTHSSGAAGRNGSTFSVWLPTTLAKSANEPWHSPMQGDV